MNGIRQILKYIDTKLLMIGGVLLVLIVVVNFVLLSGARGRVDEAAEQLRTTQQEVSALEAQVSDIRENGTGDLQQLVSQIAALEQAVPKGTSALFATTTAAQIAAASGVTLINFTEAEMGRTGPKSVPNTDITIGVLSAKPFLYNVQGSYAEVMAFFTNVLAESTWVATIESASLEAVEVPGLSADEQDVSLTGASVAMSGIILVWGLNVSPVIPPAESGTDPASPVDPNSPGPAPAPVDPNAPAPVDPNAPAPVDPGDPVPVPVSPNNPGPAPVDPVNPAPATP